MSSIRKAYQAGTATYGIFDAVEDGSLLEGGFDSYTMTEGPAELWRTEEGLVVQILAQCLRHPEYPSGSDCEDCSE
ncbi:hypothetical protein [Streptomyces sp. NPDC047525]|uniref:hypothetical protein n=1 Tax=Streptomyces sp. NPDC047525 TaxID=3155264 RepID=UPI0033E94E00